jgi:hypothetical protein
MMGEALVKAEGVAMAYDVNAPRTPRRDNWLRRAVRFMTNWAWHDEVDAQVERFVASANGEAQGAKRYARIKELQLALLEELFREKQDKITRLQACYTNHVRPRYEDLRKEVAIKDAESLAQSISVLATRAEAFRARTGRPMKISDGTVMGVPGDQPNVEVGEPWR